MKRIVFALMLASFASVSMLASETIPADTKEKVSARGQPSSWDINDNVVVPGFFENAETVFNIEKMYAPNVSPTNDSAAVKTTANGVEMGLGDRKVRDVDLCSKGILYYNDEDKRNYITQKMRLPRGSLSWDSPYLL